MSKGAHRIRPQRGLACVLPAGPTVTRRSFLAGEFVRTNAPVGLLHPSSGIPICDVSPNTPPDEFAWQDFVAPKFQLPEQYTARGTYLMNGRWRRCSQRSRRPLRSTLGDESWTRNCVTASPLLLLPGQRLQRLAPPPKPEHPTSRHTAAERTAKTPDTRLFGTRGLVGRYAEGGVTVRLRRHNLPLSDGLFSDSRGVRSYEGRG
jgi:hypothetical protein